MQQACKSASNKINNDKTYIGPIILLGLLLGVIIANIVQFPAIDHHIGGRNNPAIGRYESNILPEIARSGSGSNTEANFSFYLALSEIAPLAVIIIPSDSSLCPQMLYGLGRAASVEELSYDPETYFADIKLDDHVVMQHEPRDLWRGPGAYAFVLGEEKPEVFIALRKNETWYITGSDLLPSDAIEVLYR